MATNMKAPIISIEVRNDRDVERINLRRGIYLNLCLNCGREIDDVRLLYRNACSKCMKVPDLIPVSSFSELAKLVHEVKPGSKLSYMIEIESFVHGLEELFKKCIGSKPWSIQRSWMYRIAQKQSFAMIAPTGVGKTTFGLIAALYLAQSKYRMKTYIIVPTTVLVMQYKARLDEFMEKAGMYAKVIALHSKLPARKRIELENEVIRGEFDILITTSAYLQRKFDSVFKRFIENGHRIGFVFVDDVDAIMKGSKAIELILMLIGFNREDIEIGYKLIELRRLLPRCEEILRELRSKKELSEVAEKPQIERYGFCFENGKPIDEVFSELHQRIQQKRRTCGFVVLSSATGRARGKRVRLFRELLGFSVGARTEVYRNIVDVYMELPRDKPIEEVVLQLVKRLGSGGLIFVPVDKGIEYAEYIARYLASHGVKADTLVTGKQMNLIKFAEGELDILVGVAIYYGLLTRGIDLPERVRYAIFIGIPRHKLSLTRVEYSPTSLLRLMSVLVEIAPEPYRSEFMKLAPMLRRMVRRLSQQALQSLIESVEREEIGSRYAEILKRAHDLVEELLKRKEIIEALKRYPKAVVTEDQGQLYILIPDAPTYIQASGRTSRLFAGGITRGLSIVLVDDIRLLYGLEYRLRFYIDEFKFVRIEEVNLDEIIKQIDEDREFVRAVRSGAVAVETLGKELVKTALLVVESPNKARTIANFFGRPTTRELDGVRAYEVDIGNLHLIIVASGGHVFDIVEEEFSETNIYGVLKVSEGSRIRFLPVYGYLKRCLDCGHQFVKGDRCPLCGSQRIRSSQSVVEVLQKLALEVDEVLIGTDPDAEGEKIGYDIALALAPYARSIKRIEFHEVTRKAILRALEKPRGIDLRLVEAQITRRVEDRWIGFSLSQYVTQRLQQLLSVKGRLSAGRVQTPALGRVLELFIYRLKSLRKSKFIYIGNISIEVPQQVLENVLGSEAKRLSPKRVRVVFIPINVEIVEIPPPPPFTTDALLTEASMTFGFSAPITMRLAQDLFELGLITYHRTDSTRISSTGIAIAREYIESVFGPESNELFVPRTWGEGGAHEGIRPTRPIDVDKLRELIAEGVIELPIRLTTRHYRLYDLIFRRFIASQMKAAKVERTTYLVEVYVDNIKVYETHISVITDILEPGYLRVYNTVKVINLPKTIIEAAPHRIKTRNVSDVRMPSQGDLVKWMREVGIGRPSTYAKIVEVLLRRRYVTQSKKSNTLIPRLKGIMVYSILAGFYMPETRDALMHEVENVISLILSKVRPKTMSLEELREKLYSIIQSIKPTILNMVTVDRTSELQRYMQLIEEGELDYEDVLRELYKEMCENVIVPELKLASPEVCRL